MSKYNDDDNDDDDDIILTPLLHHTHYNYRYSISKKATHWVGDNAR